MVVKYQIYNTKKGKAPKKKKEYVTLNMMKEFFSELKNEMFSEIKQNIKKITQDFEKGMRAEIRSLREEMKSNAEIKYENIEVVKPEIEDKTEESKKQIAINVND